MTNKYHSKAKGSYRFRKLMGSLNVLENKLKKMQKEKIKTGKFDKYGNPSK